MTKKRPSAEEEELRARLKDEHLLETFPDEPDPRTAAVFAARDKFVAKLRAVDPSLVNDFQECLRAIIAPLPKPPLTDFELEPFRPIGAHKLVGRGAYQRSEGFFLALALIFNDLKGIILYETWLLPHRPTSEDPTPFFGQWSGLVIQLSRLASGMVCELLELVRRHSDVVQSPGFTGLISRLPTRSLEAWRSIELMALGKDPARSSLASVIRRIRHNGAFHYYDPEDLTAGFRRFFFEQSASPLNENALASVGANMEATRFYYADAAATGMMSRIAEDKGIADFRGEFGKTVNEINLALASVVSRYLIEQRDGGLAPKPPLPKRGRVKKKEKRKR